MKIAKFFTLALAFFMFTCVNAFQKETRKVDDFNKISLGVNAELFLKIGNTQSVVLEGDDLDEIETEVSKGKLKIRREGSWNFGGMDKIKIYITAKEIDGLSVAGSGEIKGESVIKADQLKLSVSGSGDMDLEIDSEDLYISISGSGDLELKGKAGVVETHISGSGDIDAEDLEADTLDAHISGSGECSMTVNKKIEASISGSGTIYYKGNPDHVNLNASGSGKIKKI